jgi:capsular polysaccharide biosynthesis protein
MNQQELDLRRSVRIIRQHRVLVGIVVALGLLVGGSYAAVYPPMLTSTALIVLPQSTPSIASQVVIVGSNEVLSGALPDIKPPVTLEKLRSEVKVRSLTTYIISVSATGRTAASAEMAANAVVNSFVAYVNAGNDPVGHLRAHVLEKATSATGSGPLEALLVTGLVGALAGAIVGVIVSLAVSRKDKRLRERDEIANSIGVPVLASIPVSHPSDGAAWAKLIEEYKPAVIHAWRLRKTLQQLGITESIANYGDGGGRSFAVLSLSSDPEALALGPQLAIFAASLGIRTALVIGSQEDANATAALRTAAASSRQPAGLRVLVYDESDMLVQQDVDLIIVVAVVDSRASQMPDMLRTTATLLGVSAGAATAEQLARVAMIASSDHREITGILVADPDPNDRTTGRIPQVTRPAQQRRRPSRLSSMTTEITR